MDGADDMGDFAVVAERPGDQLGQALTRQALVAEQPEATLA